MQGAASWRSRSCRAALALTALLVAGSAAQAQNFVRPPSLNIGPRVPQINPNVARATPNIARGPTPAPMIAPRVVNPNLPTLHYSPNLYPSCGAAFRDSDGECLNAPVATTNNGGGSGSSGKSKGSGARRNNSAQNVVNLRSYNNRILAELQGTLSDEQAEALGRRHGLRRLSSQVFPLIGVTIGLFQIADGRSYESASRDFAAASGVVSVQPDFRYLVQQQKAGKAEGDPAQYALAKLRLPEAHTSNNPPAGESRLGSASRTGMAMCRAAAGRAATSSAVRMSITSKPRRAASSSERSAISIPASSRAISRMCAQSGA